MLANESMAAKNARDQFQLTRQCQSFLVCFKPLPIVAIEPGNHAEMAKRPANLFGLIVFSRDLERPRNVLLHPSEFADLQQCGACHQDEIHVAIVRGFADTLNTLFGSLKYQQQRSGRRASAGLQACQPKILKGIFIVARALGVEGDPLIVLIEIGIERRDGIDGTAVEAALPIARDLRRTGFRNDRMTKSVADPVPDKSAQAPVTP